MKNPIKIYTIFLILLISSITYGQKTHLDSLHVKIDNSVELSMVINEYLDLSDSVEKDLKSLQSLLKDNSHIPNNSPFSISFEPEKRLSIKQIEAVETIILENNTPASYHCINQCSILTDEYTLQIKFDKIETLVSDNLIHKVKKVIDTTSTVKGRFTKTYNYSFKGEKLIHNEKLDIVNGPMDLIILSGGVGVNLVKNQPVVDLTAELGLMFSNKGILKNQYYLSYNALSDFETNSKINLNGFANIGYRYNLSKNAKKSNWLGLELGYLVSRQGDFFENNTFRFGMNWKAGKYMSVSPQLYFSKDIAYPALRIGFGF
ncbi:MAG: hypothetical protein C0599_07995 [Salinivirgaceae bacterium]|nr:MAG: hypothetical protein C0599_07995 [Salinivirgaceae bacterium]